MTPSETIKALRDALTELRPIVERGYAHEIIDAALALTADASEDAPDDESVAILHDVASEAAGTWATLEFQHAKSLGAGGPGKEKEAIKAERNFRVAIKVLADAARPAPVGVVQAAWALLSECDPQVTTDPEIADYWKRKGRNVTDLIAAPAAPIAEVTDRMTERKTDLVMLRGYKKVGYISQGAIQHALAQGIGVSTYIQAAHTSEFPVAIYMQAKPEGIAENE